jgi:hypothetical protein
MRICYNCGKIRRRSNVTLTITGRWACRKGCVE